MHLIKKAIHFAFVHMCLFICNLRTWQILNKFKKLKNQLTNKHTLKWNKQEEKNMIINTNL